MLDDFEKAQSTICENQEAQLLSDTEMDGASGGAGFNPTDKILKICVTCFRYSMGLAMRMKIEKSIKQGYVCKDCPNLTVINQIAKDNGASPLRKL